MSQAARNISGPISPCSKGATKMPSGRRLSSSAKLLFRRCSGSGRRSSPLERQDVEGVELDLFVVLAGMQSVEVGNAINSEQHRFSVEDEETFGASSHSPRSTGIGASNQGRGGKLVARDRPHARPQAVAIVLDRESNLTATAPVCPSSACRTHTLSACVSDKNGQAKLPIALSAASPSCRKPSCTPSEGAALPQAPVRCRLGTALRRLRSRKRDRLPRGNPGGSRRPTRFRSRCGTWDRSQLGCSISAKRSLHPPAAEAIPGSDPGIEAGQLTPAHDEPD
jgi:hypothetical protein